MKTRKPARKKGRVTADKNDSRPAGWTDELEREFQEAGAHVYDKAKWHYEGDFPVRLPEKQAFVHTGFFVGWLIEHDLISREFKRDFAAVIKRFENKALTGPEVYAIWDGALDSEMLTPKGNQFAQAYYGHDRFAKDYRKLLARGLPSFYHVADTWANYRTLAQQITARYKAWEKKCRKVKSGG